MNELMDYKTVRRFERWKEEYKDKKPKSSMVYFKESVVMLLIGLLFIEFAVFAELLLRLVL